jgi:hemoglobin-like flavoprotein
VRVLSRGDIAIVQGDWEKVERIGEPAATLLYDRLFLLDPSLRHLFGPDLAAQKGRLLRMLGAAVYGLSQPDVLMPIVEHLGRKHVRFGVKNEDYTTLASALLWTLQQALGADFGPENLAAWTNVYAVLAGAMKNPTAA